MHTEEEKLADEILRQVVCDCGNYRHHGVSWMPEGSGEGLSVAIDLLKKYKGDSAMADWDETCSQARCNKKENTMSDGGIQEAFERKRAAHWKAPENQPPVQHAVWDDQKVCIYGAGTSSRCTAVAQTLRNYCAQHAYKPKGEDVNYTSKIQSEPEPANGWAEDGQPVQTNKHFGPIPPADPELVKVLAAIKPTFAPYEEVMMILRFKVYDLITEHVPDRENALLLKKIIERTFR